MAVLTKGESSCVMVPEHGRMPSRHWLLGIFVNIYQNNHSIKSISPLILYSESRHNPKTQLSYAMLPKWSWITVQIVLKHIKMLSRVYRGCGLKMVSNAVVGTHTHSSVSLSPPPPANLPSNRSSVVTFI